MFGQKMKEKLVALGLAKENPIIGCQPEEIEIVKEWQEVRTLPKLYYDFLLAMGKQSGDLYIGTEVHYRHIKYMKKVLLNF